MDIYLQVASLLLLSLDRFKQNLEITRSKTREVVSLDDLKEGSWSIHQWLSKKLQQISSLVEINQIFSFLTTSKSSHNSTPLVFSLNFVAV